MAAKRTPANGSARNSGIRVHTNARPKAKRIYRRRVREAVAGHDIIDPIDGLDEKLAQPRQLRLALFEAGQHIRFPFSSEDEQTALEELLRASGISAEEIVGLAMRVEEQALWEDRQAIQASQSVVDRISNAICDLKSIFSQRVLAVKDVGPMMAGVIFRLHRNEITEALRLLDGVLSTATYQLSQQTGSARRGATKLRATALELALMIAHTLDSRRDASLWSLRTIAAMLLYYRIHGVRRVDDGDDLDRIEKQLRAQRTRMRDRGEFPPAPSKSPAVH